MTVGKRGRALFITAVLLLVLGVILAILYFAVPVNPSDLFRYRTNNARTFLRTGDRGRAWGELAWASRRATTEGQWREALGLAFELVETGGSKPGDYKKFAAIAGRAAASLPGIADFRAYWLWGLMRQGKAEKALERVDLLEGDRWVGLEAEILLAAEYNPDEIAGLERRLRNETDPEFYRSVAALTKSGVLAFDAALLYMEQGRIANALEIAEELDDPGRYVLDDDVVVKRGMDTARARIAHDAGEYNLAIDWLNKRVVNAAARGVDTWVDHHLLGDLLWKRYIREGVPADGQDAIAHWTRAQKIVEAGGSVPADAWRLPLNLAVALADGGRIRDAEKSLEKALEDYGNRPEVLAAYAVSRSGGDPGAALRVLGAENSEDPLIRITGLKLAPNLVSPRQYDAALWGLFEEVVDPAKTASGEVPETTARTVTSFLLRYLIGRHDLDGLDIAVDRYRRSRPTETWPLATRLAADAVRGIVAADLIPPYPPEGPGDTGRGLSSYQEYRESLTPADWRGRYDLALFSFLAARALDEAAEDLFAIAGGPVGEIGEADRELFYLWKIQQEIALFGSTGRPVQDRMRQVVSSYPERAAELRDLARDDKKALVMKAQLARGANTEATRLRDQGIEDLDRAVEILTDYRRRHGIPGADTEMARLHQARALLLFDAKRFDESRKAAGRATEADPFFEASPDIRFIEDDA